MARKIGKIILSIVLSFIFFFVAAILIDSIAGLIFGKKASGSADFNGHVLLAITTAISIAFGVWFYRYVRIGKKTKSDE